jgi:hypothetical protein
MLSAVTLKSYRLRYRVRAQMNQNLYGLLSGVFCLAAGALILHNLDALVQFDQDSGIRLKAWFNKQLGKSVLNRELWSVGAPSGFRSSRIAFRVAGVILLLGGLVLVGLSFRGLR